MEKNQHFNTITFHHEKTLLETQNTQITPSMYEAVSDAMDHNNPVGSLIGYYDKRLSIASASRGFLYQLGFDEEDFQDGTEGSLLNLIYDQDLYLFSPDKFLSHHGKLEFRMRTKDGSRLYITAFKKDTVNENGIPIWILAVRVNPAGQNLSLINDVLQSGMWTFEYDKAGSLSSVVWSDKFRQMLGYHDVTDFPNVLDSWFRLVHPADQKTVLAFMAMIPTDPAGRTKYSLEYRVKVPDGSYQWFSINAEVVRRANGIAKRMVGIFINIDTRKRLALREEKYAAFHRVLTSTNICEYYINLQENSFNSLKVEGSLLEIFEQNSTWDDLIREFINHFICEESREEARQIYDRNYLIEEFQKINGQLSFECKAILDGEERFIRNVLVCADKDANGRPLHAIVYLHDVTDSKRAEAERLNLIKAKTALDQLIQGMMKIINRFAVCDLEKDSYEWHEVHGDQTSQLKGDYSSLQRTVAKHFKLLSEGEDISAVFAPENLQKHLQTPADIYKFEYCTLDEKQFKNINIIPLDWKGSQLTKVLFIVIDITQSKEREIQARQALKDAYDAANRANKAKTDFLSNISHDIRTPMNAIVGMTALAAAHIDQKDRVMDALGKITISSRHLLALINEVLDMSRIESGKVMLTEENFHLPDLIDNLITMVKPDILAHNHQFTVNISNIRHEDIIGDSLRIQQIFTNIMSNAIKFTPDGGHISFTLTEKPMKRNGTGCFEFIFEDDGIGMSQEVQDIIFEPFFRADDKRTTKIQGTGLGLAITKNIVTMMNGNISVKSTPGKGSCFTITLFLKLQDVSDNFTEGFADLPVLIVDDDPDCCESTVQMLNDIGMCGEAVTSPKEAIRRVCQRHVDKKDFFSIILDWQMPEMDGLETARQIRQYIGKDTPIIILSAYDCSEIEEEARNAGISIFITKPLFRSRLINVFKKLTGNGKLSESASTLAPQPRKSFPGKRVLIVEDNALNMEIAVELVSMTGVTIETAENGKIAVEMVANAPENYYDLIFMDIQMPALDGYEATSQIRTLNKDYVRSLPIVAMTANAFAEDMIAAHKAGMNEYIAKPFDVEQLVTVMEKLL